MRTNCVWQTRWVQSRLLQFKSQFIDPSAAVWNSARADKLLYALTHVRYKTLEEGSAFYNVFGWNMGKRKPYVQQGDKYSTCLRPAKCFGTCSARSIAAQTVCLVSSFGLHADVRWPQESMHSGLINLCRNVQSSSIKKDFVMSKW